MAKGIWWRTEVSCQHLSDEPFPASWVHYSVWCLWVRNMVCIFGKCFIPRHNYCDYTLGPVQDESLCTSWEKALGCNFDSCTPLHNCVHSCSLWPICVHYCTLLCTIVNYCALLCTIVNYCALLCTLAHYCTLLCTIVHYCTLLCTLVHYCTLLTLSYTWVHSGDFWTDHSISFH